MDEQRECECANTVLRWQEIKSGPNKYRAYRRQCLDCGAGSPMVGHDKLTPLQKAAATEFDPAIREGHWRRRDEAWRSRKDGEAEARRAARREEYEDYINNSPNWRRLRRLVRARCHGTCEGCGERPMAEVHHLTYEHLFDEFLWELVGVCRECHRRAHGTDVPAREWAGVDGEVAAWPAGGRPT